MTQTKSFSFHCRQNRIFGRPENLSPSSNVCQNDRTEIYVRKLARFSLTREACECAERRPRPCTQRSSVPQGERRGWYSVGGSMVRKIKSRTVSEDYIHLTVPIEPSEGTDRDMNARFHQTYDGNRSSWNATLASFLRNRENPFPFQSTNLTWIQSLRGSFLHSPPEKKPQRSMNTSHLKALTFLHTKHSLSRRACLKT